MKLISSLILLAFFVGTTALAGEVIIPWTKDMGKTYIQTYVDKHPEGGTTFILEAGVYRMQQIVPNEGDTFIGEKDSQGNLVSILNGSVVLPTSGWEDNGSNIWVYRNVSLEYNIFPNHGKATKENKWISACVNEKDCPCYLPENLFRYDVINKKDVMLKKTASLTQLKKTAFLSQQEEKKKVKNRWYFKQTNSAENNHSKEGDVYIYGDPHGYLFELGEKRFAFGTKMPGGNSHPKASANVTIKNLIIEKYASLYQMGVIGNQVCGDNWQIVGNEIRLNGGAGINAGHKAYVKGNYVHDNSQIGVKVSLTDEYWAEDAVVEGNTISFNGLPAGGFNSWESGGTKFARTKNLHIVNNTLHDNYNGGGIWIDVDNEHALVERNFVYDNDGPGIWLEIQDVKSTVRYNTVKNNCLIDHGSANIKIDNSKNMEVYNNLIVVGKVGRAILIAETPTHKDKRNKRARNNHIHHNEIFFTVPMNGEGRIGFSRFEESYDPDFFNNWIAGNVFDYNRYHMPDVGSARWVWTDDKLITLAEFQSSANMGTHSTEDNKTVGPNAMAYDFYAYRSILPSAYLLLLD